MAWFLVKEYRRKRGTNTWHWCQNCPDWPTEDYDHWLGTGRPQDGPLDQVCAQNEKSNSCVFKTMDDVLKKQKKLPGTGRPVSP